MDWGRYVVGIVLLLCVVIIWVSASFLMNFIFTNQDFNKPFFVTFINTSTFVIYLVVIGLKRVFLYLRGAKATELEDRSALISSRIRAERIEVDTLAEDFVETGTSSPIPISDDQPLPKLSLNETIWLSLQFCFIWFLANFTNNASLTLTNVASSTILSSTSSLWTLIVGVLGRVEKFSFVRLICVFQSLLGVLLVSTSSSDPGEHVDGSGGHGENTNDWRGDLLAFASAICYGFYITLLKRRIGTEDRIDMTSFFGFVGLFNLICLWPFFFIFHWAGIEEFTWPESTSVWLSLLLNAFIGTCLSEYLWLMSMLMTTPLVATMGISLTIPLALIGDVAWKHLVLPPEYYVGAVLVIMGFVFVNLAGIYQDLDAKIDARVWSAWNGLKTRVFGDTSPTSRTISSGGQYTQI